MRAQGGPYIAEEIARACAGIVLTGDPATAFDAVTTDSRDVRQVDLFVPLRGAQFDGHHFLIPALEAGARGSLVASDANREIPQHLTSLVLIQVQDTLQALSTLASAHRKKYPIPLVAVTGSSGKTTVKEMIAAVLRRSHHPLVSQANYNNRIGLPMTVLNLGPEHTAAVVEAGINLPGEMDELARAAAAQVAVITTIGPVHLEGLGSIETVAEEKFKLVKSLPSKGVAVLPHGNQYLMPLAREWGGNVLTFGREAGAVRATSISLGRETRFTMHSPWGTAEIELQIRGGHNVSNALAAAAAALSVGATLDDVERGISDCPPPALRSEIVPLPGNRALIRDCYNANPQSMSAALSVLRGFYEQAADGDRPAESIVNGAPAARWQEQPPRRLMAILGEMLELGSDAASFHEEIGKEAARLGIERVVFVGGQSPAYARGYLSGGGSSEAVTLVADNREAWEAIREELKLCGAILVKGSRKMKMEELADRIAEDI
jgi:UDP-N-acetylmuramoyl-tripeptide--D-alanyl-D-alanine ligase